MKSNLKKRILAAVLCMVMVFSGSSFAMAGDADTTAENGTEVSQNTGTTTTSTEENGQVQTVPGETGETPEETQETGGQPETTTPETTIPETTVPETTTGTQEMEPAPNTVTEEPAQSPAYDGKYEDDTVTISVSAEAGVVPEGAELSVTPIEKTEITDDMSEEDKAKAEEINAQYDLTEKKLNEDSEENEETMEGFLAYDISFLVNGEEVEPSGDVKVVMDFKEAAIPEGVSEDATVAVKHLKEDETAEDGVVVEDMAEKADVQTTDKAEVERVEFTADSFSIYTIKYSYRNSLGIHVVDSSGKPLDEENQYTAKENYSWTGEKQNRVDVNIIAQDIKGEINGLPDFNKAVYVEAGEGFSYSAPRIYALMDKENDIWKCTNESFNDSNGWGAVGDGTVYFIFGDGPEETELGFEPANTVPTGDTIDIDLFDYQVGLDGDESASWGSNEGINADHVLKFVDDKGEGQNSVNIYQDSDNKGRINDNMVKEKLDENGYPVLSTSHGNRSESLEYLFNEQGEEGAKSVYSNLDKLFIKDADGYFTFNSATHYAYLKNDGGGFANEFTVGNISGQSSPGFYPFSQPTSSTISGIKESSDDAELGSAGVNHYYGMTIETSFIQPKGGVINGKNMIFEFSGDDDVWVFIDDVLVLDLGGIHGAVSGTINFATGQVTRTDINGGRASGTTLGNAFSEAGVNDVEWEANTGRFADYTTHTIKFFYLERGNRDSNCKIKFNFPTIPKNSVSVAKEVTNPNGAGLDYADDIDFQFNIKVDGNNYVNQKYALWENGEEVIDDSGKQVIGYTDSEGNFTLKHDQMAVFSGIQEDSKYQVTELGAYLNGYDVTVDGIRIEIDQTDKDGETIYSATTPELTVGDDSSVVFKNAIAHTATLSIQKELAAGEEPTDKHFQIQVKIQGDAYNGTYSVDGTPAGNASNGIIQLQAGHTATITGLPYGASFEVEEMPDGSYLPTYSVSGAGFYDVTVPTETNDQSSVTGKINGDGTVTVTNSKVIISEGKTDVTVTKTWNDDGKYSELIPDSIKVTLYEDVNHNQQYDEGEDTIVNKDALGNNIQAEVTLTAENSWTHTWSNLPADTDFVITETYPEGFEWKTTTYSNELSNLKYLYRTTSCSNKEFNLGKNNILLVKKTSNDGYFLWSVYDLKLSSDEISEIANVIIEMHLEGAGNLDPDNLEYYWGETGTNEDISLSPADTGWHLEFGKTDVWAQFWNLQYDRTENISLVNQIDQDLTTEVTVDKKWGNYQGESVTVQLVPTVDEEKILTENQINWDGYFEVTLNTTNGWRYTYENLPFYYYDSEEGKYKEINYSITEKSVTVDGTVIELTPGEINSEGYVFDVTMDSKNDFTITNNKISEWEIVKVSSTDSDIPQVLGGAEFILTKQGDLTPSYYGATYDYDKYRPEDAAGYEEGKVYWWKKEVDKGTIAQAEKYIEDGTYILKERKAPDGYLVNPVTWTIKIENLEVVSITDSNGQKITKYTPGASTRAGIRADRYLFEDTPIYELPSAGGPGIYWYTIGGILLMIAGTLVLYKNKRREVLER